MHPGRQRGSTSEKFKPTKVFVGTKAKPNVLKYDGQPSGPRSGKDGAQKRRLNKLLARNIYAKIYTCRCHKYEIHITGVHAPKQFENRAPP